MKTMLGNVATALVALILAFVGAELVVRLLWKDDIYLFPRYHTDYTYGKYRIRGLRPNLVYWHSSVDGTWKNITNSRGFRNTRDYPYEKPAGTVRVLSLGDSHTQGNEVQQEETFSAVLERALAARGQPAEVLNAGVSGFGTAEQLVLLENEGVKYRPDVVVLAFFANDFDDNLKSNLFGLDANGNVVEKNYEHVPGVKLQNFIYAIPGMLWLSQNSYFYSMLSNQVWIYAKLYLAHRTAQRASAEPGAEPTEIGGWEYTIPRRATHYQVDLAVALVKRMQQFCEHNGIRLIVVDIPARSEDYHFVPSLTEPVLQRLSAAHIEVVTSQSLFGPYQGVAEMHVPHGNHHLSAFGHTLLGVEIARRMGAGHTLR
jgi:hypothetical protein